MKHTLRAALLAALLPLSAHAESPAAALEAITIAQECVLYTDNSIVAVVEGVDATVCNATAEALSNGNSPESVISALREINAEII